MDQDYDDTFEKFPGDKNDEIDPAAAAKAAEWEMAMEDAPAFAGEWGYGETYENPDAPESSPSSDAASLTDYGLDTASRIYGLNTVLDAILETDETASDAENPMSVIDYLTSSNASPTLSYLLERISQTSAEDDLEDLAEELIQDLPETPDDTDSPESPRDFSGPDSLDDLSGSDSAENPHFPS